jgi:hypothetical protein
MKKWGCQIYKYIEEYDPFVFVSKECIPFATWFSFFFLLWWLLFLKQLILIAFFSEPRWPDATSGKHWHDGRCNAEMLWFRMQETEIHFYLIMVLHSNSIHIVLMIDCRISRFFTTTWVTLYLSFVLPRLIFMRYLSFVLPRLIFMR